MFKKINCKNCNHSYDEALEKCPKCYCQNIDIDERFKTSEMFIPLKQGLLFLTGWLGFQLISRLIQLIITKTPLINWPVVQLNMILNTLVYVITFFALVGILNKDVIKLFHGFAKWKTYVAAVSCVFAILAFTILYNLILAACGVSISDNGNQSALNETIAKYPFSSVIIFCFIGPITEELTYRVGLFGFFKRISRWVAYPVCALVFAFIHFSFNSTTMVNELLNLPFYLIGGLALSFTYDKFGFAASTTAHVLNNLISFLPFAFFTGAFIR